MVCFRIPNFSIFRHWIVVMINFCGLLLCFDLAWFAMFFFWMSCEKKNVHNFFFISMMSIGFMCFIWLYMFIYLYIIIYHLHLSWYKQGPHNANVVRPFCSQTLFVVHFASASFTTLLWFSQLSEQQNLKGCSFFYHLLANHVFFVQIMVFVFLQANKKCLFTVH